jgi:RNA ligase (TIGR02306 family)
MGVAYVGTIWYVTPIENADRIEKAVVSCGPGGRWAGVVKKGEFSPGDLVEVYLQDALLPKTERFAFMEPRGHRVRMARLRGAPSECLIMPLTVEGSEGDDISEAVGATKYEKQIPASMSGQTAGAFPSFIPKTDEVRFQIVRDLVAAMSGMMDGQHKWIATEKADGTSCTAYLKDGHFGACSRNWELKDGDNIYWQMVRKYGIQDVLENLGVNAALQFEIVGPGIQKNPMGLKENEIRLFDFYNIDAGEYASGWRSLGVLDAIPIAPIVYASYEPIPDDDELRAIASGNYANGKPREGIVVRILPEPPLFEGLRMSFKVFNLDYDEG